MICFLDINECLLRKTKCSPNAQCINTQGSYSCKCQDGYEGDGEKCYDVNECNRNPCSFNAVCAEIQTVRTPAAVKPVSKETDSGVTTMTSA